MYGSLGHHSFPEQGTFDMGIQYGVHLKVWHARYDFHVYRYNLGIKLSIICYYMSL